MCSPSPAREDNNEDSKDPPLASPLPPPFPHANFTSCPDLLFKICMPYNPEAVKNFLQLYPELKPRFSTLPKKLRKGFNMGDFLPLQQTIIWPNNKSVIEHEVYLEKYFKEEEDKGCTSRPFSQQEMEDICGGHFHSSPISVVVTLDDEGKEKKQICINLSKGSEELPSVNSYYDPKKYPTPFNMAASMAEIVSSSFFDLSDLQALTSTSSFSCQALAFLLVSLSH